MPRADWHYELNGQPQCPVTAKELRLLATEGTVTATTLVWRRGMVAWIPFAELPEKELSSPSPGAMPQPASAGPEPGSAVPACSLCRNVVAEGEAVSLSGRLVCAGCKPIALQKIAEGLPVADPPARETRERNFFFEAALRNLGLLHLYWAVMFVALVALEAWNQSRFLREPFGQGIRWSTVLGLAVGMLFVLAFALLHVWVGVNLWRLRRSACIPAGIFALVGLVGYPWGTVLNVGILCLLFSRRGLKVFSWDYQRIMAETPDLRARTTPLGWTLLGVLVAFLTCQMVALVRARYPWLP